MINVPLTSSFVEGFDEKLFFIISVFKRVLVQNFVHENKFVMHETERADDSHFYINGSQEDSLVSFWREGKRNS